MLNFSFWGCGKYSMKSASPCWTLFHYDVANTEIKVLHTTIWTYMCLLCLISQLVTQILRGNIRTEELMNFKSSSSSNILLVAGLSWALLSCEESGMVTPPCCHTFLASDVFGGIGLSDFWESSDDDEKILRPNKSSSYKPLDSENRYKKRIK